MDYIDMCNSQTLDSISLSGNGASLHSSLLAVDCCTPGKGISKSATVKQNLVGKKISRLTVIAHIQKPKGQGNSWVCKCECGNECVKTTSQINDKASPNKSCGCLHVESISKASAAAWKATTKFNHPLKQKLKWMISNMVKRCHKPGTNRYERYGGRGIQVCNEWRTNRTSFFEWAIANGFDRGLSIERINRDGNYEPSNCRFATMTDQANNTCRNRFLTFNGKTQTIAQWGRETGISSRRIWSRLERDKWTVEKALSTPFRK